MKFKKIIIIVIENEKKNHNNLSYDIDNYLFSFSINLIIFYNLCYKLRIKPSSNTACYGIFRVRIVYVTSMSPPVISFLHVSRVSIVSWIPSANLTWENPNFQQADLPYNVDNGCPPLFVYSISHRLSPSHSESEFCTAEHWFLTPGTMENTHDTFAPPR